MRRLLAVLVLLLLAACGEEPGAAQLRRDVEARLHSAFPDQALVVDSLDRLGRMETLDGGRVVHFKARLRLARPVDLGQWGGPNAQLLAGVLGAGSAGIGGLTQGGNAAGDILTVFGTVPYRREGAGWAAAAIPARWTWHRGPARAARPRGTPARRPRGHPACRPGAYRADRRGGGRRGARDRPAQHRGALRAADAGYPLAAGPPGGNYARLPRRWRRMRRAAACAWWCCPPPAAWRTCGCCGKAGCRWPSPRPMWRRWRWPAGALRGGRPERDAARFARAVPEQLHVVVRAGDPARGLADLAGGGWRRGWPVREAG